MKVTISKNTERNGLEVRFSEKPPETITEALRASRFIYNPKDPEDIFWYHRDYTEAIEKQTRDYFKGIGIEVADPIVGTKQRAPKRIISSEAVGEFIQKTDQSNHKYTNMTPTIHALEFKGWRLRAFVNSDGVPEFVAYDVALILLPQANDYIRMSFVHNTCQKKGISCYRVNNEDLEFITEKNLFAMLRNLKPDLMHPFEKWILQNFRTNKKHEEQPEIIPEQLPVDSTPNVASDLQIFDYKGSKITFQLGNGDIMVNATEMAKPFGKRTTIWLDNQTTNEFLQELSKVRNLTLAELVIVRHGGINPGTWFHEDVALEFARWLAPEFAIWCNDKIKELLKTGTVSLKLPKTYLEALEALVEQVKLTDKAENKVKELTPPAEFGKLVSASPTTIPLNVLSKMASDKGCDIGLTRLCAWMRGRGYLCKSEGLKNIPLQPEVNSGFLGTTYEMVLGKVIPVAMVTQRGVQKYLPQIMAEFPKRKDWIDDNQPKLF